MEDGDLERQRAGWESHRRRRRSRRLRDLGLALLALGVLVLVYAALTPPGRPDVGPSLREDPGVLTFPDGELFVSFSGGRDSSLVLAHATRWQRQRGLPDPVPVTNRFPGHPTTVEDDWQERVVRHLRLREWVRLEQPDVDFLGATGRRLLAVGGPFWPTNVTTLVAAAESARGGTLLTGVDGDGLLGGWRWRPHLLRLQELWTRPWQARPRDVRLASLAAPRLAARRSPADAAGWTWLTAQGRARVDEQQRGEERSAPRRWASWLQWYPTQAYLQGLDDAFDRVTRVTGTPLHHPLRDPALHQQLARHPGVARQGRTALLRLMAEGLLPEDVVSRSTKAHFDSAVWGPSTTAFVASWSGALLPGDEELVDAERLREEWVTRRHFASSRWLHSAFLADGA